MKKQIICAVIIIIVLFLSLLLIENDIEGITNVRKPQKRSYQSNPKRSHISKRSSSKKSNYKRSSYKKPNSKKSHISKKSGYKRPSSKGTHYQTKPVHYQTKPTHSNKYYEHTHYDPQRYRDHVNDTNKTLAYTGGYRRSYPRLHRHSDFIIVGYDPYDLYDSFYTRYWLKRPFGYYNCNAACELKSPVFQDDYDLSPCLKCKDCGLCQYADGAIECMPGDAYGPYDPAVNSSDCLCWYHGSQDGCWPKGKP